MPVGDAPRDGTGLDRRRPERDWRAGLTSVGVLALTAALLSAVGLTLAFLLQLLVA